MSLAPPPWLILATLVFWGWQSALVLYAIPMGGVLAAAAWTGTRWDFADRDFNRLVDLTNLVIFALVAYLLLQYGGAGLFTLALWLPLIFFPLVGVQYYSRQGNVALRSLFLSLRRSGHPTGEKRVDLGYPYLIACLVAASMQPNAYYFAGATALVAAALWGIRPRRYPPWLWPLAFSAALGLAYLGQQGLRTTQAWLEEAVIGWMLDQHHERDPYRQRTAIGQIGELKLSGRILFRVTAPPAWVNEGLLLRQASYETYYRFGTWRVGAAEFEPLQAQGLTNWNLAASPEITGEPIRLRGPMRKGRGILPAAWPYPAHRRPARDLGA